MTHPDEHTIELYLLGALNNDLKQEELEAHLKMCAGCNDLIASMAAYYRGVQLDLNSLAKRPSRSSTKVTTWTPDTAVIFQRPERYILDHRPRRGEQLRRFIRANPIMTGGAGLVFIAAAASALLSLFRQPTADVNPVYTVLNVSHGTVEVHGKADEKLWEIPIQDAESAVESRRMTGDQDTRVLDLDGDGTNEVLTRLVLAGQLADTRCVLHIFKSGKTVFREIRSGEPVRHGDRIYPSDFGISTFTCGPYLPGERPTILVAANSSHSPSIIYHYDPNGTVLGTYRHFGHLLFSASPEINGSTAVVFVGFNDIGETGTPKSVIVILDPALIRGDGESSCAGGFGLPASPAELYYVEVPGTDFTRSMKTVPTLMQPAAMELPEGKGLSVVSYGSAMHALPVFQYIFDGHMAVAGVKSANDTKEAFDSYAIHRGERVDFYADYLSSLAQEVRYWNGRNWESRAVSVQHRSR
jgi:hypothetical protein